MDYNQAVASQPTQLAISRAELSHAIGTAELLPWRTGTIAVAAMGASSHAGHVFAHQMIAAGRRVVLVDASELSGYGPLANLADSYILVTEGGRSRETIAGAQSVAGSPRLALTNVAHSPITSAAEEVLLLGHGPDSRVYTVGYTATMQALGLLAEALTGSGDGDDWDALPQIVSGLLSDLSAVIPDLAKVLVGRSSIDVVGSGASLSAVHETALMLREGPRIASTAYETYQYLHGPMESQTESTGCILFGGEREIALAQYAARRGIATVLITDSATAEEANLNVLRLPSLPPFSAAITAILPIQLLVGELTCLLGFDIDEFIYDQNDTKIGPPLAGEGH